MVILRRKGALPLFLTMVVAPNRNNYIKWKSVIQYLETSQSAWLLKKTHAILKNQVVDSKQRKQFIPNPKQDTEPNQTKCDI